MCVCVCVHIEENATARSDRERRERPIIVVRLATVGHLMAIAT